MLKRYYQEPLRALTQQELNALLLAHERLLGYQRGGAKAELARTKLDRLNLANRNLAEADFSFASMVAAVVFGTNLDHADLHCADLRDSNFTSARLEKADLRGASICGARFVYAKLDGADLRAATVVYKGPELLADSEETYRVDFSNASLKGASFGNAQLDGANFSGAILEGANFRNAQLSNVTFKNAVLTGVNLRDLDVPSEALDGCILDVSPRAAARAVDLVAMIEAHQLCVSSGAAKGAQAVLDGEDLRPVRELFVGKRLTGLSACGALAIGIDLSGCQLQGAKFDGADLRECDFSGADLRGASFRNAKLAHARFERANLGSLELPGNKTLAPDFTGAQATLSQFRLATLEADIQSLGVGVPEAAAA